MKKSELRQIIQEEIKAVLEIDNDVNRTINDKFKAQHVAFYSSLRK